MNCENWKTVRLGDVFDLQMGKTPDRKKLDYFQGSHKWISIADISKSEKYISETKECLSDEAITSSGIKSIPKDTLIMSFKLSIGKTAITSDEMYSNEAIMAFLPNGKCETDNSFLYHLFSNKDWSEGSNKAVKGITLNKASLSEAKIPLPPLATQKHIATVLDKCAEVIAKHKLMLEKYDTLIKSQFVEMFGDPVQNPMGWKQRQLQDVCNAIVDCPHSTPNYTKENTGFMCIRTNIIRPTGLNWNDIEYISENEFYKRVSRRQPRIGDIVYLREGGILGIAAIINRDVNVALGQRTMLLSPNYEICNSIYVCETMNMKSFFNKALEKMGGSASPHINVADIKVFPISVPPLELQNDFAAFVQAVDAQKAKAQKSLEKAEILYKALMQQYFA